MDPGHNKVKIDQFYLKKIVLSIIRGDQFLYIFLEFGYKHSSCHYSVFSQIFNPFPLRYSFCFILSSFFHLYPSCVDQIVGVDPCPISNFQKSLGSSYKAENYCSSITFSLIRPESQLQSIQCGGSSFLLDIIWLSSILCFQDACPYQQNLLECCPRQQTTPSNLGFAQLMMHSFLNHLLGLL